MNPSNTPQAPPPPPTSKSSTAPPPPPPSVATKPSASTPAPPPPPPVSSGSNAAPSDVNALRRAEIRRILDALRINPLSILKLRTDCTPADVKAQYKAISLLVHPDKCPTDLVSSAKAAFALLNAARDELLDDAKRALFTKLIVEAREKVITKKCEELTQQRRAHAQAQQLKLSDSEVTVKESDVLQHPRFEEWVFAMLEQMLLEKEWEKKQSLKEHALAEREAYEERTKRKAEEEAKALQAKEWEETREQRVGSWRGFLSNKKIKMYRPPTTRIENNQNKAPPKPHDRL